MIRPLKSEKVRCGKSLFMIIRALMASYRKVAREVVLTSKKFSRYQILSKPYLNRHRWTGIRVLRRAEEPSLRNSAI